MPADLKAMSAGEDAKQIEHAIRDGARIAWECGRNAQDVFLRPMILSAIRDVHALAARHDELLRRLSELERENARLREGLRPGPCSVCVGRPLPDDRRCVCETRDYPEGSPLARTEVAEMHGLRLALLQVTGDLPEAP